MSAQASHCSHYQPPLQDIRFVQQHWLGAEADWRRMPAHEALDQETADMVVEAAGRFCADVLAPLNGPADLQGCRLEEGRVRTPDGFPEAYAAFVEAGWPALACAPEAGGQGLPQLLDAALHEMLASANHGWTMYPGILHGAYACLHAHGDAHLRATYLPHIVSGRWLATMCLTEPQAGSDLGLLRSQARPRGDGSYSLDGSKIFISGGDQDMSENIVHLVLARLPDAPAGTRGLSLFLAPRGIPQDGGGFLPNAIHCDGIEKKMGIKGSATCAMRFEGAQAWLVGQPHQGLAAMFVMMNSARLHVGLQGLGHAEMAWQLARAYAAERRQMRAQPRPADAQGPADPIALQPAVQRMLADLRVWTEGMRAIAGWVAHQLDLAEQAPDAEERAQAHALASLLTPVVKSFFTERGFALASEALQVFGGYGYVHEYRIEQTLRDARIAMIYEGTNQIQALDLLQRKVAASGGAALAPLLAALREEAAACEAAGMEPGLAGALRSWSDRTEALTGALCARAAGDAPLLARCAEDYLRLVGTLCMAFAWARAARVSQPLADPALRRSKADSAAWFFAHGLLDAEHWLRRTESAARTPLPAAVA
ncbi:acyl-CoA dehydrogenase domain protein [Delftia acidovorans SPH-1]|uniref:3-methylmercaptopropionyl-CoA dehydrogenase n=4 Tax=Delftia acidovorans TaxID=80866 RepID=A9BTY5_DELAS|nr:MULTISPECIES: acyl-CoA dehydrogenase [Delftia]MCP4014618.1 acyl-CoA dehydrogenase [Delftia sp.]OLE95514.1 MAG: acyl-CoA dehydrogenase [Delftia sp. 13_1_40CM_3_66_6]ABX35399.1 acyl-CoA dehydrogenase domain protein [Delftia acidovorans SPH-1]MCP4532549.1 acyl-CoA dehydrogenase [Delftia sp.]OLE04000.1 MAG: acyl-CoA dehydrogenase [Delftia sp. 13_1_20CM_4_67_18]